MYANPCGGSCYDGLGQVENGRSWWEAPVTQITGAIAERISGPTSPYSPGTYLYGDTGMTTYPADGQRVPLQTARAATGYGLAAVAGVALLAALWFGR